MSFDKKNIWSILIIILFSCLTYSNSLSNEFCGDDWGLLVENPKIRSMNFFYLNLQGGIYYRPVMHMVDMLNYQSFGLNPSGYHMMNLFLFTCSAVLLYAFLNLTTKQNFLSLLASLLFVTHPINGILVNYKTASGFSVLISSALMSMIFFVLYEERKHKGFLVLSLATFLVALLCHETMIILPLYLLMILVLVKQKDFTSAFQSVWVHFLFSGTYFLLRLQFSSIKVSLLDKFSAFQVNIFEYIASLFKLLRWYVAKLIYLKDIVLIWVTPPERENVFFWNLIFILCLTFLCFFIVQLGKKNKVSALGLSWMIIGFMPVTLGCLFQPSQGFWIEPHWLFFSSIGFFILVANTIFCLATRLKWMQYVAISLLLFAYILVSRNTNFLWSNAIRYCTYWLSVAPHFYSGHFYLADAYMRKGDYIRARAHFPKALVGTNPYDWQVYSNLGLMSQKEGDIEEALKYYNAALLASPNEAVVHNNIGSLLLKKGEKNEAKAYFTKALAKNSFLIETRLNLANIYRAEGDILATSKMYDEVLSIDPHNEPALLSLIQLSLAAKENGKANDYAKKILEVSKNPVVLAEAGSIFAQHNFTDMAFALYFRALKFQPRDNYTILELGKLYGNLEDFDHAILVWEEGWKFNPEEGQYKDLIQQARQLKEKTLVEKNKNLR